MSKPTAVLFCPGRGSYGREELGSLGRRLRAGEVRDALEEADTRRREAGHPGILELDAAASFRPSLHLDGRNASELLFFASMAEIEGLRERYRILAVAGNSLGWYTALCSAGSVGGSRRGRRPCRPVLACDDPFVLPCRRGVIAGSHLQERRVP